MVFPCANPSRMNIHLCSSARVAAPGNSAVPAGLSSPRWVPSAAIFPTEIYALGLGLSSTAKLRVHACIVSQLNTVEE